MSGFYEELCNLFIRPIRQSYSDYDLGSPKVTQDLSSSVRSVIGRTSLSAP